MCTLIYLNNLGRRWREGGQIRWGGGGRALLAIKVNMVLNVHRNHKAY